MWIDTHCHLDAAEFIPSGGGAEIAGQAAALGVNMIVIPAVQQANFETVADLGRIVPNGCYALGIHPITVPSATEADLEALRCALPMALQDPRFVAIGEIGLDFFVPMLKEAPMREKQTYFFVEQLKMAREFDLPVLLHVRRSQDEVLKQLRRIHVPSGIAHAFNGSLQQAKMFAALRFKLGFGGAMTFTRALQIRRLAVEMPLSALVLETDAPDIAPSWLHPTHSLNHSPNHIPTCNTPDQIPAIGAVLAQLRGISAREVALATSQNALAVLPRLANILPSCS